MAQDLFNTCTSGRPYDTYRTWNCGSDSIDNFCKSIAAKTDETSQGSRKYINHPHFERRKRRLELNYESNKFKEESDMLSVTSRRDSDDAVNFDDLEEKQKADECSNSNLNDSDTERGYVTHNRRDAANFDKGSVRLNLLGKPLLVNRRKRKRFKDQRIRKYQFLVHNFLEKPHDKKALLYHMLL